MAATVTLAQLRERSRLYADERPAGTDTYLTNPEVTTLVNMALKELYDRLVAARGQSYYQKSASFNTVSGTAGYAATADFYELLRAYISWSSTDVEDIPQIDWRRAPDYQNASRWGRRAPKGILMTTGGFLLVPTPNAVVAVNYDYVPTFADLVNDADTFDGINGWDKSVALRCAIEIRRIQQEDASDLKDSLAEEIERIEKLASDRAALTSPQVVDVYPEYTRRLWPERLPRP